MLWDNYRVKDGQGVGPGLQLRAFTGRSARLARRLRAHAINPASQPLLGCVPALTLAACYAQGDSAYAYGQALLQAATEVLGRDLARDVVGDLIALQDTGLDQLGVQAAALHERYTRWQKDPGLPEIARLAAAEITDWLGGGWRITDEIVRTQ